MAARTSLGFIRLLTALAAGLAFGGYSPIALSAPLLRCELTYAGSTQTLEARPVSDPYPVPSVDVGGRFRFKPVMVGDEKRLEYIKLYAYLETRDKPVLIQLAKYLPPFRSASGSGPVDLTGVQYLYGGPVERELMYQCSLSGIGP